MVERRCPYYVGEHIDCLDTVNKWLDATVASINTLEENLLVSYTGFDKKYDEWISYTGDCKRRLQR